MVVNHTNTVVYQLLDDVCLSGVLVIRQVKRASWVTTWLVSSIHEGAYTWCASHEDSVSTSTVTLAVFSHCALKYG